MNNQISSAGLELANLLVTSPPLHQSWDAVQKQKLQTAADPNAQMALYISETKHSNTTIISFLTSPVKVQDPQAMISSTTLKDTNFLLFEFLCSKKTPSFSVNELTINFFALNHINLDLLRTKLVESSNSNSSILITGHSFGGCVATLFTLWLLQSLNLSKAKRPLCITFGSPLTGDEQLQQCVLQFSTWSSCFLNVASINDPVPKAFLTASQASNYKPFGTFLLCSASGGSCFDDPDAILQLLVDTGSQSAQIQGPNLGFQYFDYGQILSDLKLKAFSRDVFELVEEDRVPLKAGIKTQLAAIFGVNSSQSLQQQQPDINFGNLMQKMETQERNHAIQKTQVYSSFWKLNEIKKYMAYMEGYKKESKEMGIGYYDRYRNKRCLGDINAEEYKKKLSNYWEDTVAEVESNPQKEGATMRTRFLFGGTNYRRMIEPLHIAEYYKEGGKDYIKERPRHFVLLEQWFNEDAEKQKPERGQKEKENPQLRGESKSNSKAKNVASSLNDDSCFCLSQPEAMAARKSQAVLAISAIFLLLVHGAHSFYLPGVTPQDFLKGDRLKVKVNTLTSTKTQLPYSYYSLPYCQPERIIDSIENLGEVLRGDRIKNSPYVFRMREPQMCNIVCRITPNAKIVKEFKEKIDDEYRVNMILDNLPLVVPIQRLYQKARTVYRLGFHVGLKGHYAGSKEEKYFIHNHLAFTVKYHKDLQTGTSRIVGFEVKPFSVKHEYEGKWNDPKTRLTTCDPHSKHSVLNSNSPQEVAEKQEIVFTYDVEFQESDVKWASRWDAYLRMSDDQIHWFSIVKSLVNVLFLSCIVAMIMLRTLYRDISKYNELETQEEAQEETGWKLVHGDVFRAPNNSELLCVYVGTGVQLFGMILVTMIFAVLGFLSPSNRGGLMTTMLLLFVFMGLFAGYASVRLYKTFQGTEWMKIAFGTAVMFPATVSAIFIALNTLIWGQNSSGAVPFGTMLTLVYLWLGISVPLVFVGGYVGFRKLALEDPVKTNKVPREIPEQTWYKNPVFSILIGGILPFGAVFNELFFILTSIWLNQFYYIFGFLFLVFIILIITCAEITIVLCYFQLCSEDYLWWWRSYLTSGSSALYLFLYATFYFFTRLEITKLVSVLLYFGYMLIASYAFFVVTGTIGFYACFWFTRLIYSS